MSDNFKKLAQQKLPTVATMIYQPLGTMVMGIIKKVHVVNMTNTGTKLTMWQSGTNNSNMIVPPRLVDAYSVDDPFDGGTITIEENDTLYAKADDIDKLIITVWGDEVVL